MNETIKLPAGDISPEKEDKKENEKSDPIDTSTNNLMQSLSPRSIKYKFGENLHH